MNAVKIFWANRCDFQVFVEQIPIAGAIQELLLFLKKLAVTSTLRRDRLDQRAEDLARRPNSLVDSGRPAR